MSTTGSHQRISDLTDLGERGELLLGRELDLNVTSNVDVNVHVCRHAHVRMEVSPRSERATPHSTRCHGNRQRRLGGARGDLTSCGGGQDAGGRDSRRVADDELQRSPTPSRLSLSSLPPFAFGFSGEEHGGRHTLPQPTTICAQHVSHPRARRSCIRARVVSLPTTYRYIPREPPSATPCRPSPGSVSSLALWLSLSLSADAGVARSSTARPRRRPSSSSPP